MTHELELADTLTVLVPELLVTNIVASLVPSIDPILQPLSDAAWPPFLHPERKSYQAGETVADVTQFLVQDPDGYLLRFTSRATVSAELTR
jgi:hypothetical protein